MRIVGNIDNIPELTSSIKLDNIHQIFTSISSDDQFPMSILIEGHPGIGKTTLAKEICLQWATNNLLTSDKMLIFLMLRDPIIQNIDAIEELIKYALPAVHVKPVLHYLHAANGAGFTFIIDGFDELSNKLQSKSLFRKLIEGDVLPNARVVITSRPFVSACLHQYVNRRIEVLGFEKSSKEKYTEDALIDHPNELQNLRAHFQLYPNIEAMCYIPLNMAIIIYLCQVGCLPPTATEMFKNFVLHIICRHLKREKQISEDTIIGSIKHLPQPIQKALHKLEEVAFDGLVKDKLVFTKNDLPEMCKENPTCYGLLQSIECFCSEEIGATTLSLNFLHLGIQEYFAANYVRTLSQENIFALLEESFLCNEYSSTLHPVLDPNSKSVHLSNMWILYCGITGGQCKSLSRYLSVYNLSLQGVEEYGDRDYTDDYYDYRYGVRINDRVLSNNVNDCSVDHAITNNNDDVDDHGDSILDDMDDTNDVDKDNPKFPHYHNPEKYTEKYDDNGSFNKVNDTDQELNNTQTISQIILADPVKVLYLFQCFQEAQNDSMCEILSKSYWNSNNLNVSLLPHQVVSLGFFLSKSTKTMTHLNMSNCHIGDHGIKLLHHYLCENKQEMERLDFSYNDLTEASSIIIGDIIIYLKPRMLILCNNSITELKDISTAVIHTKSLKELWITSNGLAAHKAMPIADMITSLEVLFISFNKLGDNGAIFLSEGIKRSYTLKKLNIQYNDIGATGATAIANSLMQNTSLQELDMDHNVISESGATAIGLTLTKNSTLTKLEIGNNKIGREGAIAIAKSLPQNYTLKALYMNNNAIGQDGAIAIAHCLSGNISLMILNLCNNDIDPSRATMIVKMITENRTMQNLDVSNGGHGSKTQSVLVKETRSRSIEANNNFNDNASLKVLNVNNAIDQSGVVSVANFLIKNSSLRMLHMNTNAIGQDGARAIAKSLMFNDFLKVLSMNNNSIGQGGAIAIADCLIQNTSLEMLEINENCIGHEGAIAIANSLAKNKSLQVLHMNENKIGPNGAMAIAEALCQNTSLDILHINSNAIGEDGAAAIAKSIKHNTSVWNLHMDNNSIGNCGAEAIAMNIGNNKELQLLSLCDDNTINEESAAKIVKNLHCNNTITGLKLPIGVCNSYVVQREVESINDTRIKSNVKKLKVYCIP
ncbi:protein NLRC3-like [Dysidea avara]|uniref:protein NLRC3-like n=1 Tax=Dysidea avara TaxID=196820 RepID=UPI00331D05C6